MTTAFFTRSDLSVRFDVTPHRAVRALLIGFAILLAGHIAVMFIRHGLGLDTAKGLVPLFHFDSEFNVPTVYSVALMLLISISLFAIFVLCRDRGEGQTGWRLLGYVFLFLAADELWSLHETLDQLIRTQIETSGIFYYAWVVPYAVIGLVLAAILLPWFLRLERNLQLPFMLAGMCYVGGAMGFEMIGGAYYSTLDEAREVYRTFTGDLISSVEEAMEITGLSVFLWALVLRLTQRSGNISIQINRDSGRNQANIPPT